MPLPPNSPSHTTEQIKEAFALYKSGQFAQALSLFHELAESNSSSKESFQFFRDRCLEKVGQVEASAPAPASAASLDDAVLHDIEVIKGQGLFDAEFYRNTYPDLRHLKDDECLAHFCEHGFREGRKPIKGFYPAHYKSVLASKDIPVGGNPLAFFARQEKRLRDSTDTGAFLYPEWICARTTSTHFEGSISALTKTGLEIAKQKLAVFCHIHYSEVVPEVLASVSSLHDCADFHFTFSSEQALEETQAILAQGDFRIAGETTFMLCENKGRDLLPFLSAFEKYGHSYDLVLKIHGKRSADSDIISGAVWRDYLLDNLVGSKDNVLSILRLFAADQRLGIVYPPHYEPIFQYCTWGTSLESRPAKDLMDSLRIDKDSNKIISFPSGSMFWAKPEAIAWWMTLVNSYEVEPEPLPRDGTSLHFFERVIPFALSSAGYTNAHHLNCCTVPAIDVRVTPLVRIIDIVNWKIASTKSLARTALAKQNNLMLNTHEEPECSIVVPIYKNYLMTLQCLCSIYLAKDEVSLEVIVVDDCSPEHLNLPLSRLGIKVIRNQTNLGFVGSCNVGAANARGKKIVFLNNDTIVLNNWLKPLASLLDNPEVGIAGSMLLYPDGSLQEAGGCIWQDGGGLNYGRNDNPSDPKYNFTREVDYCSGASLAIRSADFKSLGGFDQAFSPGYYEDTDLCFKARAHGLKVVFEPQSKVIHLEGKSSENAPEGGMKKHQEINRDTFVARWSGVLAKHTKPHENRFFANRSKSLRILVLDSFLPTPDKDSGSNDFFLSMKLLHEAGYEVTFMPTWEVGYQPRYLDLLQENGIRVYTQEFQYHCPEWIKSLPREFDLCMIIRYDNYHRFAHIVKDLNPGIKFIFDSVDLHFVREQREAETIYGKADANHIANLRQAEIDAISGCDHSFVRSMFELDLLRKEFAIPSEKVSILPICRQIHAPSTPFKERKNLIFIGGFKHKPNVDCIAYFLSTVFPLIVAKDPSICLTVAGSHIEVLMERSINLAHPNINTVGYVEDLRSIFEMHRLSIAPLRYGAGTKGKVISSLCHGLPCVATTVACEGMAGIENDLQISIRDKPHEFADACVELHNTEALWQSMSDNALSYAHQYTSIATMREALLNPIARIATPVASVS